jgi:tetratricopeptide (TPR) repeat protein
VSEPSRLLDHFRAALQHDPAAALRDWFRAQEELRARGDDVTARALAEDFWILLPGLSFPSPESRARFFHGAAVFFGSPGPAADLARARSAFAATLAHFSSHAEDGWRARALHNLATAIANLGASAAELEEATALFAEALNWRSSEREIARAVTLHNRGRAWRRLAELDPAAAPDHLARSADDLREAIAIRERNALKQSLLASRQELSETLSRLGNRG